MNYKIKGNLSGYICEDCREAIFPAVVYLYLPWQQELVVANTVAATKETFRLVTPEEKKERSNLLISKSTTDENGNFEFVIDEKYASTAFDIDFECGNVPRTPPRTPRRTPLQFHLTTFYPRWIPEKQRDYYYHNFNYAISSKWWCYIRGYYFDAWTICGHLDNCETQSPIANATVKAFDADLFTDDFLGSAVTDAGGHFRIDYTSADFKVNSIPLNLETDPSFPFFSSGPDIYFKAEIGGTILVNESSADRRNNVGYCLCVDLCSKIRVGDPNDSFPSAWTGIGQAFNVSFGGPFGFDADGYAGTGKYALFGGIRLTGQAPAKSAAGNPIEYRFLVSTVTTPNGTSAPALSNFSKVVGKNPADGFFIPSVVAKLMEKSAPFTVYNVNSNQADFDGDGWFDINKAIARTQADNGLGALSNYWFIDQDTLMMLNTHAFTSALNVPVDSVATGNPVTPGSIPVEKIAIRFEIREVVNKPANIFNIIPGSGKTLNAAIINNNSSVVKLGINEMDVLGACAPISGLLHAKYTVYHPHLQSVSLNLHNNSYSINRNYNDLGPAGHVIGLSGNTNPAIEGGSNNALPLNPANDLVRCTYALTLSVNRRLHNGDSQISHEEDEILFFYDI